MGDRLATPSTHIAGSQADAAVPGLSFVCWNAAERAAALGLLLFLSPLLIPLGIAIRWLASGSPLIAHRRIGRHGDPFWMLKLRTMWGKAVLAPTRAGFGGLVAFADQEAPIDLKGADDPRIASSLARFCRRYSLDELPQLVHVISGRMSFVGPRPLTWGELDRYYGPAAAEVLTARPGLSGLWQIMGRSRLTYAQRKRLDLFLVRHATVRLHAAVLLKSVPAVLRGKDSW